MIELNKNKLIPGVDTSWGDIRGDISKQSDLMSMMSSYATQSWVSSQGYLTEHQPLKTVNNQSLVGTGNITIEASVPDYYATKSWVSDQGYLTSETLPSDLATESWVSSNFLPTSALSGYATESWVSSNFLSTTALSGYATQSWVESQSYITSVALSGYATESWVSEQGYLTSVPSTYATQSWVEAQSYLTSSSMKTVNDQSLVGEGNIEIGGLTPEQEAAIEPLEEAEKGMLYTFEIPARTSIKNVAMDEINTTEAQIKLYDVDGDIYFVNYSFIAKYNPEKINFEFVCDLSQTAYYPLWKDATGRYYIGVDLQVDLSTGTCTDVSLNVSNYWNYYNDDNIVKGKKGIYFFDTNFKKFDEANQEFVSFTCTYPEGIGLPQCGASIREYNGHLISFRNGYMYEFIESDDSAEIVQMQEPYFDPMPGGTYASSTHFFKIGGEYYYLWESNHYKLVNGLWVSNPVYYDGNNVNYFYSGGVSTSDYLIGFNNSPMNTSLQLSNPGDTSYKLTYWAQVKNVAVDLGDSTQYIGGSKHFNNLHSEGLYVKNISNEGTDVNINFGINKTKMNTSQLDITVTDFAAINGSTVATTDDCIVNRTMYPCGPRFIDLGYDSIPYQFSYYWTTATGRLFVNYSTTTYEYDGTTFNQVTLTANPTERWYVVSTATDTFYADNNGTYIWDNANDDWLLITADNPAYGETPDMWCCGDTIRYSNTHKLVESGGTWSWVEDALNEYYSGTTYVINNTVYVLNYGTLYTYDESTKTYTLVASYYDPNIRNYFVCDGEIYIVNYGKVKKLDMSLVGVETSIDVETNVYYVGDAYCFYGMYGGYLHMKDNYYHMGYCFDVAETVPEVPSANGTYVLQAVRSASGVTFSWVSAV